jgi:hypothetical protein
MTALEPSPAPEKVTGAMVTAALRDYYSAPEWAIFFEVPSATGGGAARRADAIAMSLWPSRGLEIHGFEIKVDRRDWLRELKTPEKAEEIAAFCDRWWVVAAPDVAKDGELPAGWGLLLMNGTNLRMKREAPKREGVVVTRPFLAALLRAASTQNPAEEAVRAAVEHTRKEERARAKVAADEARKAAEEDLARLQKSVDDFETSSGVRITQYDGQRLGEVVRLTLRNKHDRQHIERFAASLKDLQKACDAALAVDLTGGAQ